MNFNVSNAQTYLNQFDFTKLFIEELGWDRHSADLSVITSSVSYALRAVAEKRGMVAWVCEAPAGQLIPNRATRKKIETQVAKTTLEHLIIFTDAKRAEQVWCWARREPGKPASVPEHFWYASSGNRGFMQKLGAIAFSLSEENTLTLFDVTARARAAFDVERVTKRFYDQFKVEHKAFLGFIEGITEVADTEWYASLMLNRLMFIYFMQRKGFLNGERDYLRNRLALCQKENGQDSFYSFYRYFLLRLFHEGLGRKERNPELDKLLGRIPYLNGGLFERHQIEERCPDITIPDEAFTRIFTYFDRYQWHLDERPLRNDNEINPDVLGYIFEKYINQKQMGAYYTKEDITEYISQNTVIPFILDVAKAKCNVAFDNPGGPTVWHHLRDDPDRYIHASVKHGTEHALPPEIEVGIQDVSARAQWNQKAPSKFGLPTEIWREVVTRRVRYAEIRAKLAAGEVHEVNDLITLNIDMRQFAQDVIELSEGPDLLRAFWTAIENVTVLDPTCGSGAFLFAALNILEPLYEACLGRMEAFVADLERSSTVSTLKKFDDFKATLAKRAAHPNARYFTLKSIILNNLFGVDIMEEAVEICKLRLFLKLAAQVDPDRSQDNLGIEPLPDIDFNIRAGNSLVGYATYAELEKSAEGDWIRLHELEKIKPKATELQRAFDAFRAHQVQGDGTIAPDNKPELRAQLRSLENELNQQLSKTYGVNPATPRSMNEWLASHQPFHWFVEFFGIMSTGGFDVIVGNPPYVEYSKVQTTYKVKDLETLDAANLYAYVAERSATLMKPDGRLGLIVPIALVSVSDTQSLRMLIRRKFSNNWFSNFAIRPAKLFDGVEQRLTIWLAGAMPSSKHRYFSTKYMQWYKDERPSLLSRLCYADTTDLVSDASFPKVSSTLESGILSKLRSVDGSVIGNYLTATGGVELFFHRTPGYWIRIMDFEPYFRSPTATRSVHHIREISISDLPSAKYIGAIVSSSLYFFWFFAMGNCRNLTLADVKNFRFGNPSHDALLRAGSAFDRLMADFQRNSTTSTRGDTEFQEFDWSASKPIVDEIDAILGEVYGLSKEEVDFITSYDVKIRLGKSLEEEEK